MKNRTLLMGGVVLLVVIATAAYFTYAKIRNPEHVHYHAGIQVYIDGKLQDYSSIKYMTISPCVDTSSSKTNTEEKELSPKEIQNDKGHLHDNVGDVMHVHIAGGTWKDFFSNINVTFPEGKQLYAFVNGRAVGDILNTPIRAYDSVVIFVGSHDNAQELLKKAVSVEHIKEVEKKSELCGAGGS